VLEVAHRAAASLAITPRGASRMIEMQVSSLGLFDVLAAVDLHVIDDEADRGSVRLDRLATDGAPMDDASLVHGVTRYRS
jgi:hypothetical protein